MNRNSADSLTADFAKLATKDNGEECKNQENKYDFNTLQVDPLRNDDLPFPDLPSRVATSIAFSFLGRQKKAISILLKLTKSSRNFIISQKGLPGFIMKEGDYSQSCVCELHLLETSASFRNQYLA